MQYLIFLGSVDTDVLGCAKVAYLRIERGKLRHLDECPKPLFLNDVVCDGELVVSRFLGKDCCPRIKAVDSLFL